MTRRNGVAPNLLCRWRRLMLEQDTVAVTSEDDVTANRAVRQLEDWARELEYLLARKTLEVEFLKEALPKSHAKKILHALSPKSGDAPRECRGRCFLASLVPT